MAGNIWAIKLTFDVLIMIQVLSLVLVQEWTHVNISVTPTPANDQLFITGVAPLANFGIVIYNNTGKAVLRRQGHLASSPINIGHLPAGNYLLKLSGTDFAHQQQIIVSR